MEVDYVSNHNFMHVMTGANSGIGKVTATEQQDIVTLADHKSNYFMHK